MAKFDVEVREHLTIRKTVQIETEGAEWDADAERAARLAAAGGPCDGIEVTDRVVTGWSEVVTPAPEKAKFRVTLREVRTFTLIVEGADRDDARIVALKTLNDLGDPEPDTACIDLEDSEVNYVGGLA